jgi:LPXTG-site transpeptidase (sortase) family protein
VRLCKGPVKGLTVALRRAWLSPCGIADVLAAIPQHLEIAVNTSTVVRRRVLLVKLSFGVITGAICLVSAACTSSTSGQPEAVAPPTTVPSPVATLPPPTATPAPTAPATLIASPTAVVAPPTSTPVAVPTTPPAPRPTATSMPTAVPALPEAAVPVSISIPRLNSSADIVPLGLDADGSMAAPSDPDTIGWYDLSARVGRPGNTVVVGHVDWGGRLRAFGLLRNLHAGDQITIVDALERELTYSVQTVDTVKADSPPDEYLTQNGPQEQLTLITCGGTFDHASHQYLSRVIVQAVRETPADANTSPAGG